MPVIVRAGLTGAVAAAAGTVPWAWHMPGGVAVSPLSRLLPGGHGKAEMIARITFGVLGVENKLRLDSELRPAA